MVLLTIGVILPASVNALEMTLQTYSELDLEVTLNLIKLTVRINSHFLDNKSNKFLTIKCRTVHLELLLWVKAALRKALPTGGRLLIPAWYSYNRGQLL